MVRAVLEMTQARLKSFVDIQTQQRLQDFWASDHCDCEQKPTPASQPIWDIRSMRCQGQMHLAVEAGSVEHSHFFLQKPSRRVVGVMGRKDIESLPLRLGLQLFKRIPHDQVLAIRVHGEAWCRNPSR